MIIRQASLDAFERSVVSSFEDELIAHCHDFSPNLCKTLPPEQLRLAIQQAIADARVHGLTRRGPILFYIDCTLLFGSGFATDPQYPWFAEILARDDYDEEMHKAEALHEKVCHYLYEVGGADSRYMRGALRRLLRVARSTELSIQKDSFQDDILRLLEHIYPEKLAYTGLDPIKALLAATVQHAREDLELNQPRSWAVLVMLTFAFGHRCDDDPLFPWIGRTLSWRDDESPDVLAEKLERRATAWFEAVLETELA